MWWKNRDWYHQQPLWLLFQYPLRVNVVEKPQAAFWHPRLLRHFQYPLRVNVVEKPPIIHIGIVKHQTFSTLSGSMWWKNLQPIISSGFTLYFQYPLRVNVVEKPSRQTRQPRPDLLFQYPLRVNVVEKPLLMEKKSSPPKSFQYPLRVNVVEKPDNSKCDVNSTSTFSTLSGSMWWKNHQPSLVPLVRFSLSVPSPGQCGGKTGAIQNRDCGC